MGAIARVALEQRNPRVACPRYLEALDRSFDAEPPPYGAAGYHEIFRAASANGHWMAISLMTNAEREGDGATRLWSLAACSPGDSEERKLLMRHAVDESSHAQAYLAILDLSFPGAVTPEFRTQLDTLSPGYSMNQPVHPVEGSPYARTPSIDDFIQMNVAEIRTTIHHLMQREAIANHCPPANLPRVHRIMDSLLRDELSHVAYTAVLIEQKSESADRAAFHALFRRRIRDFNELTENELKQRQFD